MPCRLPSSIQAAHVRSVAAGVLLAFLSACTSDDATPAKQLDAGAADASVNDADVATRAPDGAVIACGAELCDGSVVTPVATLETCCATVGPGGFGKGGGCGLTDPPPFGTGLCAPLKGPGVLDPSCPDIVRPLQTYKGCCTPQGKCGGFANKLFGYTVNYGCGVEDVSTAKDCTPPSAEEAAWKPDPVESVGECMPKAGDCFDECACKECPDAAACINDPGCKAILDCGHKNNCSGGGCLTPCGAEIAANPNASAAANAVAECQSSKCAQCMASQDADAGT